MLGRSEFGKERIAAQHFHNELQIHEAAADRRVRAYESKLGEEELENQYLRASVERNSPYEHDESSAAAASEAGQTLLRSELLSRKQAREGDAVIFRFVSEELRSEVAMESTLNQYLEEEMAAQWWDHSPNVNKGSADLPTGTQHFSMDEDEPADFASASGSQGAQRVEKKKPR